MTGERHAWARAMPVTLLLRLPLEVSELFAEWLRVHYPDKLKHVLSLMRSAREGKLYDSRFGARMTGSECLDDWAQVRGGGGRAWTWTKPRAVALRFIPASVAPGRAIAVVLKRR